MSDNNIPTDNDGRLGSGLKARAAVFYAYMKIGLSQPVAADPAPA